MFYERRRTVDWGDWKFKLKILECYLLHFFHFIKTDSIWHHCTVQFPTIPRLVAIEHTNTHPHTLTIVFPRHICGLPRAQSSLHLGAGIPKEKDRKKRPATAADDKRFILLPLAVYHTYNLHSHTHSGTKAATGFPHSANIIERPPLHRSCIVESNRRKKGDRRKVGNRRSKETLVSRLEQHAAARKSTSQNW